MNTDLESDITGKLKAAIRADEAFHRSEIEVKFSNGTVLIEGFVDELWKKIKTEIVAFEITGVEIVQNELLIMPSAGLTDMSIGQRVKLGIAEVNVPVSQLDIFVSKGSVTLKGNVSTINIYRAASSATVNVDGVECVNNRLLVISH